MRFSKTHESESNRSNEAIQPQTRDINKNNNNYVNQLSYADRHLS